MTSLDDTCCSQSISASDNTISLDGPVENSTYKLVYKLEKKGAETITKIFHATKTEVHHSNVLSTVVENDKEASEIPLIGNDVHLTPYAVDKAIEYMKYHKDGAIEIPEAPLKDKDIRNAWKDPWDIDFINTIIEDSVAFDKLFQILHCANYLDIKPLLHLGATKMATILRCALLEDVDKLIKEQRGKNVLTQS